jgi:hypothetical protein
MNVNLIRGGDATIINELGSVDPFETTFAPAKPVLDAVVEMWKPLAWLDQRCRSRAPLFEPERAAELIDLIPSGNRIAKAGALFLDAEENSAPEPWLHIAVGLMLQSEANSNAADSDAFRCAIADGAFRDPEVWGQYDPGFSAAVIVRSIRQARRQDALPSPGGFLNLCIKQRAQFKTWNTDLMTLLHLRWEVEDAVEKIDPERLWLDYDPEDDVPF